MTRPGTVLAVVCWLMLALLNPLRADTAHPTPDFKQVYDLIRQHLSGANEAELNRIAVESLLSALAPRVSLVEGPSISDKTAVLVTQASLFDGPIAYLRVGRVESGLDKALREAWQQTKSTNKLAGLVIDLRFTQGTDYSAAVAAAQLFIKKEQPLLDWGKGMVRSKDNSEAISVPLAVLVNAKTAAAAEALAAVVRSGAGGLILGARTAGQAMISEEFPLTNGGSLRIATNPIQLGDGAKLAQEGLKPDIAVAVNPGDERAYYSDAFKDLTKGSGSDPARTNAVSSNQAKPRRPRFNEAELVRERRDGAASDSSLAASEEAENEKPVVRDPVLGRALDFLKGLSLVHPTKS